MKWFQHDTDAVTDRKLMDLAAKYGAEGIGVYWTVVEKVAAKMDPQNMSLELEEESYHLAQCFWGRTPTDRIDLILQHCENIGLFQRSPGGRLMCKTLMNKLDNATSDNKEIKRMKSERRRFEELGSNFQGTSKSLGSNFLDIPTDQPTLPTDVPGVGASPSHLNLISEIEALEKAKENTFTNPIVKDQLNARIQALKEKVG